MPSSTLPFFVRHGEIVSVLAILVPILVALLSVLALYRLTRRKANRATDTLLESLGAVTPEKNFTAGQNAVLEGVLKTISPSGSKADSPTKSLSPLDIADGIEGLELRGNSTWAIAGSAQILWDQNLSLSQDELQALIEHGHRVRIAGTLQKTASPDQAAANYREEAATWALEGTRRSPLRIVSCETTRPKLRVKPMLWTSISALGLLFFFTQCVGSTAIGYAEDSELHVSDGDIEYPLSLQIASAIPYYRTQAVEILRQKLWDDDLGQVGSAQLVNWHIANRDCTEAAQTAFERGHLDWAKEVVESCPKSIETSTIAFSIYLRRGEFDRAVEKLEEASIPSMRDRQADSVDSIEAPWWMSSDLAAKAYVLAGRFDRVAMLFTTEAESLEAWAAQLSESLPKTNSDKDTASHSDEDETEPNAGNDQPSADSVRVSAAIYRCLAALAKHYDGQAILPTAFAGDTSVCRLAQTEVLPLSERSVALKAMEEAGTPWTLSAVTHLLLAQYKPIPVNRFYRFRFIKNTYSFQHAAADLVSGRSLGNETKAPGLSASVAQSLIDDLPSPRRAALLLNRSYSEARFGKMKLAKASLLLAREDLLALSPDWLKKHATPQSDGTIKSTDWDTLVPDDKSNDFHLSEFLIQEFEKTELLLAALSVREHNKERAVIHVANARNLQRSPHVGDFYKGDNDSELAYLLGDHAPSGYRYGVSPEEIAQFQANPGKFRSRFFLFASPLQYTRMWLSDLLRLTARLADVDAPQWKAELDASTDHWYESLMVRERSLYLELLEAL